MKPAPTLHPLRYVAATLGQMAQMLRDFDMPDSALLLEKVKDDIEKRLIANPEQEPLAKRKSSSRDLRGN